MKMLDKCEIISKYFIFSIISFMVNIIATVHFYREYNHYKFAIVSFANVSWYQCIM